MSKCKRCHAPDELNGIGLCKHCTAIVKNDVRSNKERLEAIYNRFPEDMESLDEAQKAGFLEETKQIFYALDQYHRIGFPVGSYVMPVRKILHFLDPPGAIARELLARHRRRKLVAAACCAALTIAFTVLLVTLYNNPLTGGNMGEAVAVSGEAASDGAIGTEGIGMEPGAPMQDGEAADGLDGAVDGEAGAAAGEGLEAPQDGEASSSGEDASEQGEGVLDEGESVDGDVDGQADDGGEAGDAADGESAATAGSTATAGGAVAAAPRRVSGGGIAVGGNAIRIG